MKAERLLSLPPYLFEELENRRRSAMAVGRDVIDLSIGDPDLSPPAPLISALKDELARDVHHRYPPQRGVGELKAAIRRYLARRVGIEPADDEMLILVGSKEGLAHLPWAVCNPGDVALVPDPGYPVYESAARFAGCRVERLTLVPDEGFLPDFGAQSGVGPRARRASLCFLNYPNNPTGAVATPGLFSAALSFAEEGGAILVNDAAYADVYFGDRPVDLLCGQSGALQRPTVEFFSFSKTFSITGWRVGFAVGRRDVIEALAHLKANIDSGVFGAIQCAIARMLDEGGDEYAGGMRRHYGSRRQTVIAGLEKLGFQCFDACATFYVWTRVPVGWTSIDYALHVLERADVLVTPGVGFGRGGEGFFRIALTRPIERLEEALDRLASC